MRTAAALALMLGVSLVAEAAGLGKLTVNSALGQILNAEIDLVSLQPGEVDSLTARVAAPEAFRDARIEYGSSLRLLRFSVEKRASGQPYLKVTSVAPINEPFVDVLIEVTWPAGRVQREYPILLDPPGYAQSRPPAVAAATPRAETPPAATPAAPPSTPASSSPSATTGTGTPSASAEMPATSRSTAKVETAGAQTGSDTYGPVQKGETLNKIATQVKPEDVTLEQMLVALYRENQAAFVGNNMNRLRTGQILKVPSAAEVNAITKGDANKEIRTHVADWKGYRDSMASGVASIPAMPASSKSATGTVSSAAVTPPAPPAAEGKDTLKLSKSDSGSKGGAAKGGGASQDQVNALREEVTAKDKALRESQSRVADLEKQIRDMQRLLELKGSAPGKADSKVATAPPPPAKVEPPPPAKVEPPKPVEMPKADTKPAPPPPPVEPPKPADAPKPVDTKVADSSKPAEPPKDAAKPAPPKTDAPKAAPKKAPPPEPSLMDTLADNWLYIAIGVGALALLGGGFAFMRRRKATAEAGPSSSMTSAFPSDLKPDSTTGKAGGGLVDTGNSSFLTDFDKTGPGTIDTDEVDPVAEAEVYIAYGRDAQAEEILKEAMARDKGRHEIALKLLEIYHARKSATAFETVAKELHEAVGDSSPLWQKAAAMGSQIDPQNPLYAGAAASGATYTPDAPAAKPDVDFAAEAPSAGSAPAATDFDIGSASSEPASSIDFNIDTTKSLTGSTAVSESAAAEPPKEEKPSFDFDLSGLDFPSSKPAEPAAPSSSGGGGLDLADLSLDSPAGGGDSEGAGTKLELAKAYLEIGDKDGARDILLEVAKEGSSSQKEEAQKLIASL